MVAAGTAAGLAAVSYGLYRTDYEKLPRVAVLSSAFFVASLVHVPIGPTSVHLVLNGLVGIFLGWAAFPAICVALLFQALLLQEGGLLSLGVNTLDMALPALLCRYVFVGFLRGGRFWSVVGGGLCGALGVAGGVVMVSLWLLGTSSALWKTVVVLLAAHVPVMVIEAAISAAVVSFLWKAAPEMLEVNDER